VYVFNAVMRMKGVSGPGRGRYLLFQSELEPVHVSVYLGKKISSCVAANQMLGFSERLAKQVLRRDQLCYGYFMILRMAAK
jgi:hypothetical protein